MGIEFIPPQGSIDSVFDEIEQREEDAIITNLSYVGETAIIIAREEGDYRDITGNLRSSIGYVVLQDGKVITKAIVERTKDGTEGAKQLEELLPKLQSEYRTGFALIVVAGMNYAAYVEDIHHRVVLSSAKLKAEELAKELLNRLFKAK